MGGKTSQKKRATSLCLLVLVVVVGPIRATSWWSLGIAPECAPQDPASCRNCAQFKDDNVLTEAQATICSQDSVPINAISVGTRKAIVDCQFKFKNSKWNCSTFYGEHLFGKFISNSHTRETAVINAYTVAGSIQAIAEACHDQRIRDCLCLFDGPPRMELEDGTVVFEECKDNINFASNYIDTFIGGLQNSSWASAQELASAHNIQVGKNVINSTERSCICHGVSGTCSVQTCHTKAPDISSVGEVLQIDYHGAVKVEKDSSKLINVFTARDRYTSNDLVFTDDSPNFCIPDIVNGIPGVEGRKCEPNGQGSNACQNLCCDFGFHSVTFQVPEEKCSFVWCCRIECQIVAIRNVTEHRCNGPF